MAGFALPAAGKAFIISQILFNNETTSSIFANIAIVFCNIADHEKKAVYLCMQKDTSGN